MLEPLWKIPKKERRRYIDSDGNKLPSVTEILDALGWNKGALMGWANKIGRGGQTIAQVRNPKADAGSLCHHLIECVITEVPWQDTQEWVEALPELQEKAATGLGAWQEFWPSMEAKGWSIVDCELALQADDFAGTADLLLRHEDGGYAIGDIKTGSPHPEAAIQMAGYAMLVAKQRLWYPDVGFIFHVPTDGRPVTAHCISHAEMDAARELFCALLQIHGYKDQWAQMGKRMQAATPKLPDENQKGAF